MQREPQMDLCRRKRIMTALDIANAVFSLLIVLGLIGAIAWLIQRWGGLKILTNKTISKSVRRLAIRESLSVGTRHRLVLLRRDDREYLVLLGPNGDLVIDREDASAPHSDSASLARVHIS